MNILVTGATGFVGRHVVARLVAAGHRVTAVARSLERAQTMPWYSAVEFIACDVYENPGTPLKNRIPDILVHLAWPGLPNYKDSFHIYRNLPGDMLFLEGAVDAGVKRLLVAGTCLEYGLQEGELKEAMPTQPGTPYGLAKDTLRKALEILQASKPFALQWMRLFYMYGEGQNKNSLLAQLDAAIDSGQPVFNMSQGDQRRDYLPVTQVAENFLQAVTHPEYTGIMNCCSGVPMAVIDLVEQHLARRRAHIALNRGYYPYPTYEPFDFWGQPTKLAAIRENHDATHHLAATQSA